MVIIFIEGAIGGALPWLVLKCSTNKRVFAYMNCGMAGSIFGVALLHILNETGQALNKKCGDYPTSYCLVALSFIIMVILIKDR